MSVSPGYFTLTGFAHPWLAEPAASAVLAGTQYGAMGTEFTGTLSGGGGGPAPTADENANALLDLADGVEAGWTVRQLLRLLAAVIAGNSDGKGANFRDPADTKYRIQSTLDSGGNRTVTSRDPS